MSEPKAMLEIRDLRVTFPQRGLDAARGVRAAAGAKADTAARAAAVDGVSLTVFPGQCVAVVGESGSGKSLTALATIGLLPGGGAARDGALVERGSIRFHDGERALDLLADGGKAARRVRGGRIAMIFQEPMTSLNPVYTIGEQVGEAAQLHRRASARAAREMAAAALREVGIDDGRARLDAYPHEFSGGMRQRAMIAMALVAEPRLILADEPTTALDATVQLQVLDLLARLRRERGMGVLLITHSMGVVRHAANVVCVMYAGRVLEYGRASDVLGDPMHPYTRALLACVPRAGGEGRMPASEGVARLTTVPDVLSSEAEWRGIAVEGVGGEGAAAGERLLPWWPTRAQGRVGRLARVRPERWVQVCGEISGDAPDDPPSIA